MLTTLEVLETDSDMAKFTGEEPEVFRKEQGEWAIGHTLEDLVGEQARMWEELAGSGSSLRGRRNSSRSWSTRLKPHQI